MDQMHKKTKSEHFFSVMKNIFIVLLVLQFAPVVFSGLRSSLEELLSSKVHVGYLAVNGDIIDTAFYIKKISDFLKSDDVKALLLRINSPGGYSGSCHAIFNELKKFRAKKPIVAVIENVGASGAYYLALPANSIIASPMSMVGSIGVFMELPNVKDFLASWKVQYRYVQSGTYKTTGSAVKDVSADELSYLQKLSDSQYNQFVHDVVSCRRISAKDHKIWADGKIFSGIQALDLKLIDKLGSMTDALEELKRVALIKDDIKLIYAKKQPNFVRLLTGEDEYGQESMSLSDCIASCLNNVWLKFMQQQNNIQTY